MQTRTRFLIDLAFAALVTFSYAGPAYAQVTDCMKCHARLLQKKFVHGAIQKEGCTTCHGQLDATTEPHRYKGKAPKELAAESPGLCGKCHEDKLFQGKLVHGPVASKTCTTCHSPHASDSVGLLIKEPAALCLDCHPEVKKRPHVIVGFSGGGHPLGDAKKPREVVDPLRPGKPFYCAACHEPHRSDLARLMRFDRGMASCQKCHNM